MRAGAEKQVVSITIDVGDWIDVMDSEGTWNVAQVLRFPSPTQVEVKYDGWGDEFNEIVLLNGDRVAPYHTYTWTVKCWAKYKDWPWWPSVVTIRSPGTEEGKAYLMNEQRLFVDFFDHKDFSKRCRCWVHRSKIEAFELRFDERRNRKTRSNFESSLTLVLQSTAVNKMPTFSTGTLSASFEHKIADPVPTMKKGLGQFAWIIGFNSCRERHAAAYVYKVEGVHSSPRFSNDSEEDITANGTDGLALGKEVQKGTLGTSKRNRQSKEKGKVAPSKKFRTETSKLQTSRNSAVPPISRSTERASVLEDFDEALFGSGQSPILNEELQQLSPIDDSNAVAIED